MLVLNIDSLTQLTNKMNGVHSLIHPWKYESQIHLKNGGFSLFFAGPSTLKQQSKRVKLSESTLGVKRPSMRKTRFKFGTFSLRSTKILSLIQFCRAIMDRVRARSTLLHDALAHEHRITDVKPSAGRKPLQAKNANAKPAGQNFSKTMEALRQVQMTPKPEKAPKVASPALFKAKFKGLELQHQLNQDAYNQWNQDMKAGRTSGTQTSWTKRPLLPSDRQSGVTLD